MNFRLKVLAGEVNVNYRLVRGTRLSRYYLGVTEEGLTGITKEDGGVFTGIARSARGFMGPDNWHTVEIRGFDGHLRVLVDGVILVDGTDEDPLHQGTIGFLTTEGSELVVDNIEVLALTKPLPFLVSSRPSVLDYVDRPPPIASLITIGSPRPDGVTLVTGDPGSVPPLVLVSVATTEYADEVTVTSAADGGFSASVLSAPGATIQVRYDPNSDEHIRDSDPNAIRPNNHWPGTLIRVVDPLVAGDSTRFSGAGSVNYLAGDQDSGVFWAVAGTAVQQDLNGVEEVSLSGTLRVYDPGGVNVSPPVAVRVHLGVDPMFDADGRQAAAGYNFVSRILTPTGLPIERSKIAAGFTSIHEFSVSLENQPGVLGASFETTLPLPPWLPLGTHRLYLWVQGDANLEPLGTEPSSAQDNLLGFGGATVTLLTVGTPGAPRLSAALLVNTPNQGTRGTIAIEDQGQYELADRIATQVGGFVVEPRDRATGNLIQYRLEPFFPFLSLADRFVPNAPVVPLDLPGGSLRVTVHTPSGSTDELGTHPILQTRTGLAGTRLGRVLDGGGGNPSGVLQLTTLSDAFSYRFAEYGRYTVALAGSVPDIRGGVYPFDGTYEVWAAETLDLEAASLPSTPFQLGDWLPTVVNVYPGVPADVEMSFELHPIDGSALVSDSVAGTANRFGYFDGAGKAFELTEPGEYLVNLRASYTDAEGRLWMGARRWGSGVASASLTLIAHGRRGEDTQPIAEQRAWFTRLSTGIVAQGNGHINYPYHSGDIIWAANDDSAGPVITVQDLQGRIADLLESRAEQDDPGFQTRRITGDLPLLLSTSSGLDATLDASAIDQWGYAYFAAERPGVRVRELIGSDTTKSPYWRFEDLYVAQRGMGPEGDLPKDIKWMFGTAVFKRPDMGIGEVAIYGSLWVEIGDDDAIGTRVFPPFQGAAGGPSGGPIMSLKGQEIDIFLMPTAVRPGTVLEVGDRFVFAGQVGPALASKVTALVTSPSGSVHEISGQANPIGYFSDPAGDFVVDEPGVWSVEVQVLHDGMTSAGPVEPPYPTGGVLGSADGSFQVFVVRKAAARIDIGLPDFGVYVLGRLNSGDPAPLRFSPRIPDGWSDVRGEYTISMPGFILEEGSLEPAAEVLEILYAPTRLHEDFTNIDLRDRSRPEPGLTDEVFISVLLSGTDASGQRVHAAKVLTLVGEDVYNLN